MLIKYTGKYVNIYFNMKITFLTFKTCPGSKYKFTKYCYPDILRKA